MNEPAETGRRRFASAWIAGLLLVFGSLAIYSATMWHGFVRWDDYLHLHENPHLGPLGEGDQLRLWTAPFAQLYNPLVYTWWAALASLGLATSGAERGLDPFVFHAGNVVLQIINELLLWRLLTRLVGDSWAAAWGAALFAVHPLAVETVAWVAEARGLLAMTFLFAALDRYVAYLQASPASGSRRVDYTFAFILFALSLTAKSSAAAGPLLAALLDWGWFRRPARATFLALLPWTLLVAVVAVVSRGEQSTDAMHYAVSLGQRPFVALDALAFYLGKLIWPIPLGIDYGRRPTDVIASGTAYVTMWVPIVVGLVLACLPNRRRWLVGGGLFVAALAPVLGLIPFQFQDYSTVADRYAYLALLGPAWCAAWLADNRIRARAAMNRDDVSAEHKSSRVPIAAVIGSAVLLLLAVLSFRQQRTWRDDFTLFTQAEAANPKSAAALGNLGQLWFERGDIELAASFWEQSAEYYPEKPSSLNNLALLRLRQGRFAEAQVQAERLLALAPTSEPARDMIMTAQVAQGTFTGSPHELEGLAARHGRLAEGALRRRDHGAALFHAEWSSRMSAGFAGPQMLARVQRISGDRDGAADTCRRALERWPDSAELHHDLGLALAATKPAEARTHYAMAIRLRPDFAEAHNNLGTLAGREGRWPEAVDHFRRAIELRPTFEAAQRNLTAAEHELARNRGTHR